MRRETYAILARTLPFLIYMSFVALLEIPTLFGSQAMSQGFLIESYPLKISMAAAALFLFRKSYTDLKLKPLADAKMTALSVGVGLAVFIVWINLNVPWAIQGELTTYDPTGDYQGLSLWLILCFRVMGAVLVVPIMEELFWRSFLVRYLAGKNFVEVKPGTFTLFSFSVTALLFGLEHQLFIAGIVAGIAYNYIYWKAKNLSHCVLSHAVTNTLLAAYVLLTRSWHFW
ncbi:CAAX prenyl protease-related protein [Pseudodesulfovibrio cashew]|uniref:CAAX prenyl protease-related protein n=1 Tax=Pseudodesulfovibrio cashew TaxID=2678688 RepID=A0A6I6JDF9_9BACT|nr:CAAX prenyl protease-related protein [Pseudodesulfovibrio cashew]QGY39189.1 CAAX prenyl protease-related protein [Pseudodesulfovibrio cashew]